MEKLKIGHTVTLDDKEYVATETDLNKETSCDACCLHNPKYCGSVPCKNSDFEEKKHIHYKLKPMNKFNDGDLVIVLDKVSEYYNKWQLANIRNNRVTPNYPDLIFKHDERTCEDIYLQLFSDLSKYYVKVDNEEQWNDVAQILNLGSSYKKDCIISNCFSFSDISTTDGSPIISYKDWEHFVRPKLMIKPIETKEDTSDISWVYDLKKGDVVTLVKPDKFASEYFKLGEPITILKDYKDCNGIYYRENQWCEKKERWSNFKLVSKYSDKESKCPFVKGKKYRAISRFGDDYTDDRFFNIPIYYQGTKPNWHSESLGLYVFHSNPNENGGDYFQINDIVEWVEESPDKEIDKPLSTDEANGFFLGTSPFYHDLSTTFKHPNIHDEVLNFVFQEFCHKELQKKEYQDKANGGIISNLVSKFKDTLNPPKEEIKIEDAIVKKANNNRNLIQVNI